MPRVESYLNGRTLTWWDHTRDTRQDGPRVYPFGNAPRGCIISDGASARVEAHTWPLPCLIGARGPKGAPYYFKQSDGINPAFSKVKAEALTLRTQDELAAAWGWLACEYSPRRLFIEPL